MSSIALLIIFVLFYIAVNASNISNEYVHMETMKSRSSVNKIANFIPHQDTVHELTFAIKQSNTDKLHDLLMERSTPGQPLYQQWMSNDEVRTLTTNQEASYILLNWFAEHDIAVEWMNRGQEYFRVKASINTWEQLLQTTFYQYEEIIGDKAVTAIRAESYSLPSSIAPHIMNVFGVVDFPVQSRRLGTTLINDPASTRISEQMRAEIPKFKSDSNANMISNIDADITSAAVGPTVLGYVEVMIYTDVGCNTTTNLGTAFAIGPCIPFSASIVTRTSSLQFFLNGSDVLFNAYNDELCMDIVIKENTLPPKNTCSYFNNQYALITPYVGTTIPPLPTFKNYVNFEVISFFQGSCAGTSPIQVDYFADTDQQACQTDLQCFSTGYQRYGMNAPVNMTFGCVTGLANYGIVTPLSLSQQYTIPLKGGPTASQSIFASIGQSFNPSDLTLFQQYLSIPHQSVYIANNHTTDICLGYETCLEANLDVQYITGMSQGTNTTFWYVNESGSVDPFLQYLVDLLELTEPPMVNSISYGGPEEQYTSSFLTQYAMEATKLGLMGVTIIASSGDDGVVSTNACNATAPVSYYNCACTADSSGSGWTGHGYFPLFPASCPYVTAVGATQLTFLIAGTEISASSLTGAGYNTGGGFSAFYSALSWQSSAISSYFGRISSGSVATPASGYNKQGRGYPDVAMNGFAYNIIVNGFIQGVSGTSASAPVFAAMISSVNAHRIALGQKAVGFINPTLYANSGSFHDITYSSNLCESKSPLSKGVSGFAASQGWDPVSGLGSIQFAKLQSVFSPSDSSSSSSTNNHSLSAGAIAGITIAVLVVVAAMIVGVLIIISRRRGQTGSVSGSSTGSSVAFGSPWSSGKAKGSMKTPLITELTDEWKTTA